MTTILSSLAALMYQCWYCQSTIQCLYLQLTWTLMKPGRFSKYTKNGDDCSRHKKKPNWSRLIDWRFPASVQRDTHKHTHLAPPGSEFGVFTGQHRFRTPDRPHTVGQRSILQPAACSMQAKTALRLNKTRPHRAFRFLSTAHWM